MLTRREMLVRFLSGTMAGSGLLGCATQGSEADADQSLRTKWMDEWMDRRTLVGPLHLARFVEPVYFLISPIAWAPSKDQSSSYSRVDVPIGFVTDLASIPRLFWSALRPDGEYTYPAIVHDYMYWQQSTSREVADEIFRLGMLDLGISSATASGIHKAVRWFGGSAWDTNAAKKKQGERRVLRRFPDTPSVRWSDWRLQPEVFSGVG